MKLFLIILLFLSSTVFSEESSILDPDQIFFASYEALNRATEFEKHQPILAYKSYEQALLYLESLSTNYPDWKPDIVKYRLKSTLNSLSKLQSIADQNASNKEGLIERATEERSSYSVIRKELTETRLKLKVQKERYTQEKSYLEQQIQDLKEKPSTNTPLDSEILKLKLKLSTLQNLNSNVTTRYIQRLSRLEDAKRESLINPLENELNKLKRIKVQYELDMAQLAQSLKKSQEKISQKNAQTFGLLRKLSTTKQQLYIKNDLLNKSKNTAGNTVQSLRDEIQKLTEGLQYSKRIVSERDEEIKSLKNQLVETNSINEELRDKVHSLAQEKTHLQTLFDASKSKNYSEIVQKNKALYKELQKSKELLSRVHSDKSTEQSRVIKAEHKLALAKDKINKQREEIANNSKRITSLTNSLELTQKTLEKNFSKNRAAHSPEELVILTDVISKLKVKLQRNEQFQKILWNEFHKVAQEDTSTFDAAYKNLDTGHFALTSKEIQLLSKESNQLVNGVLISPRKASKTTQGDRNIAIAKANATVDTFNSIAKRFIEKDNLAAAKDIYDEGYEMVPDYSLLMNRGTIRMKLKSKSKKYIDESLDIFKTAIAQKPNNSNAHFMLGVTQYHKKDYVSAKRSLQKSIEIQPDYPIALLYLGLTSIKTSDLDDAHEYLEKSIALDPDYSKAHYNMAVLYYLKKNLPKAQKSYQMALNSGFIPNLELEKAIQF